MKGLPNLIRLNRWRLDEKRKKLAELERLFAQLSEQERKLEDEMKREQQVAARSDEALTAYGAYARGVIERREKLAHSKAEVDAQIDRARGEEQEAFRELKRFEVAYETRQTAQRRLAARVEQAMLDDMGQQIFRRRRVRS
ncbi:MAG: flagellar FliJ family protein [Alphaproteobacteria bacterium]